MKTIALTIAAAALTASAAHAESPMYSPMTEVVADDTPGCLSVQGDWSDDDTRSLLAVFNGCQSEVVLTCPLEGQCRLDQGEESDVIVIAPGQGASLYVPHGSGVIPWQMDDGVGSIHYVVAAHDYGYECGLSAYGCTASPGMESGDLGWFAFALVGLVLLRRRGARSAQNAA